LEVGSESASDPKEASRTETPGRPPVRAPADSKNRAEPADPYLGQPNGLARVKSHEVDVAVVGAGLAGTSAAAVLAGQGRRVLLLDPRAAYPDCFKAEKVEPDQAELMRELGLMDAMAPALTPIHEVLSACRTGVIERRPIEQYGTLYHDLVNGLRARLPEGLEQRPLRARGIETSPDLQRLSLEDGTEVTARLVVLACGASERLAKQLGMRREWVSRRHSLDFGFYVAPRNGAGFAFDALTYYPDGVATRLGCLSLFPVGTHMRANLFTYQDADGAWAKRFQAAPAETLLQSLPGLEEHAPGFEVTSRIEWAVIELYRVEGHVQPGVVVIGDAFQGVCPITGTGLSKVFRDVATLCLDCVPTWLESPGMGAEKVAAFYDHPRKVKTDQHSLESAFYSREIALNSSWRWRRRAALDRWSRRVASYLKLTR